MRESYRRKLNLKDKPLFYNSDGSRTVIPPVTEARAIFNLVSKVIRDCIGFALLCSVIGLENSCHLLNQSDAKLK